MKSRKKMKKRNNQRAQNQALATRKAPASHQPCRRRRRVRIADTFLRRPGRAGRLRAIPGVGWRAGTRRSARREAAAVLRRVLRGDASRRAAASIKSLVYSPSVRNKRATFALVCQTLKSSGKASCMVAIALCPKPGWKVIDACAAPGNKTVHLAVLMNGEGSITACELNKDRTKTLQNTIRRSGANNIQTVNGGFLDIDSKDSSYAEVRAILLDPSCSGCGTSTERLDYLLPSHSRGCYGSKYCNVQNLV